MSQLKEGIKPTICGTWQTYTQHTAFSFTLSNNCLT